MILKKKEKQTPFQKIYVLGKSIFITFLNKLAFYEILAILLTNNEFVVLTIVFELFI